MINEEDFKNDEILRKSTMEGSLRFGLSTVSISCLLSCIFRVLKLHKKMTARNAEDKKTVGERKKKKFCRTKQGQTRH